MTVACSGKSDPPLTEGSAEPRAAPVVVADASRATFVRVSPDKVIGTHWMRRAPGERVGDMDIVGAFTCKLDTLFGPPDPFLFVTRANDPPGVGFPLQHIATGELIVAMPEEYGYAGVEETPAFKTAADELDALLASTTPRDCEHTFAGAYRVNRAGVRGGKPFFEHLDFVPTLDYRLVQFEHNDQEGDWKRKSNVEDDLCESLRQNWTERRDQKGRVDPSKAAYPRRGDVERRLRHCLDVNFKDLEAQITSDWFDYDAVPEMLDHEIEAFEDLDSGDPELGGRLQRLRTLAKQKAAKLRRGN